VKRDAATIERVADLSRARPGRSASPLPCL
jgi:hypothetical protein